MSNAVAIAGENVWTALGRATAQQEGKHLRFVKGDYIYGVDGDELAEGTEAVAVMNGLTVGWTRWRDGKPAEERTGLLAEGFRPARREDLGDLDRSVWPTDDKGEPRDPWQFGYRLPLVDRATGETLIFSTSSRGGIGAIGQLSTVYGKHLGQAPDELPVVALEVGSYQHTNKAFGRIKFPVLRVVGWTSVGGDNAGAGY